MGVFWPQESEGIMKKTRANKGLYHLAVSVLSVYTGKSGICEPEAGRRKAAFFLAGTVRPDVQFNRSSRMAGAWRLELQTYGFGDRRSTN